MAGLHNFAPFSSHSSLNFATLKTGRCISFAQNPHVHFGLP